MKTSLRRRHGGTLFAALVAAMVMATDGCAPRPATALVLRFGSDIDMTRVRRVEVDVSWSDDATPFALRTYSFVERLANGATRRFPGSITIAPVDALTAVERRRVLRMDARVIVEGAGGAERVYVRSRALARLAKERTVVVDMYFSDLCGATGVSERCLETETCQLVQSEARCVPVETQAMLPDYSPSAPPPMPSSSAPDASAPMDAALPDVTAPPDAASGDASAAQTARWWPWHGARMSSGNVQFRWNPAFYTGAQTVQVCSDRACNGVLTSMAGAGGVASVALTTGAFFWRVFEAGAAMQAPTRVITVARSNARAAAILGTHMHMTDTLEPQWLAGAPGTTQGAIALALPGPARPPWALYVGPPAQPLFGSSVANVGDLDNDGYSDIAVGTRVDLVPAPALGVTVFYGAATTPFGRAWPFNYPANTRAGYALGTAGDLDGDGSMDMLIGAPAELSGSGRVHVFNGVVRQEPIEQASDDGVPGSSGYGTVLAGGCDFDGDGYGDYVVGAVTRARNAIMGSDPPSVHVVFGGPSRAIQRVRVMPPATFTAVRFGAALACGGDTDGDGLSDLAVGDPRAAVGALYVGAVSVFAFSGRNPVLRRALLPSTMVDGGEFGASVSFIANVGDRDDLLVGIPGAATAKAYFGASLMPAALMLTGAGTPSFGRVVAAPGLSRASTSNATIVIAAPEPTALAVSTALWSTPVADVGQLSGQMSFAPMGLPAGAQLGAAIAY